MGRLDRYIGRNVLLAILGVLLVLLGLALLFAFIDELTDMSEGYGLGQVARYVLLTAPGRAYELLPMAALIGCLVGLGSLATSSELTVMRAAGVSLARIVLAVMKPLLVLMLAGVLVGEYVAPLCDNLAQSGRSLALAGGDPQSTRRGLWHRQGDEFIHINSVQPNGELIGVTRYRFDAQMRMLSASFARRAQFTDGEWYLQDVATTHFHEQRTETERVLQLPWAIDMDPQVLAIVVLEPDALSIRGLWSYIHYLGGQGLDNAKYWLAFWSKVLQPLITAALVLLAISFIFGPLRSVTLGQRLFTGVLVGFIFRIGQDLLGPASLVYGFSPLLAVLVPALVCASAGWVLLRRAG